MKIQTKLGLGFGIQVLLTAALGLSVLFGMARVKREFSHGVEVDAPVMANARHLSKLVVDMETGQRGFCITQKDEFLEPYFAGAREFDELIKEEKKLVSNKPGQVAVLERIEYLVHEWQEKAARPEIAMARKVAAHHIDAQHLQEVLGRGVGKRLMDTFMALGHELELSFSERGDWEGAYVVEIIEKCMADREDGQRGFLITGKDEFLDKYVAGEQQKLPAYFARLRAIVSDRGRGHELSERIDQLELLTREWTEKAAEPEIAARRVMNEHPESLKDISALLEAGTGKTLVDEIRREFDNFVETEENDAARGYGSASETTVATRNIAIALLCLATCVGTIIAVVTGRAVARPLARLARGVEAVGSGHLQTRIEGESPGEIGSLIRAFNAMGTDLCESQEKLEVAATTDKLTGLPNRAVFLDRLEQALKQAKRIDSRFAVLFFDFDRFKVVNDSLGHEIGDVLLCAIADIFRDNLRESDTVARIGGDEFVLLLTNLSEWSDARMKSDRLLEAFATPHFLGGRRVVSTASIGLVTNEFSYNSASEMIRDADAAMYQAKDAGRGRVVVFDQAMYEQAIARLSLEEELCNAIDGDQFKLVYQPIVNLETGELAGFEALLRWIHPERGTISPVVFIPIAEETGLIVDIGRWVLRTASRQIADWNHRLGLNHRLSMNVNLSKRELQSSSILGDVLECQHKNNLQPGDLKLEVTESAIVDDRSDIIPVLHELRKHGFLIAMDDFGTGLSSLGALHDYPIDILKIDQSFISALDSDRSLLAVVNSITTLANNLGFTTVAEGIETEAVVGALQSIGCTWGQGYYFAKPLSPSDAEAYLLGLHQKRPCAA